MFKCVDIPAKALYDTLRAVGTLPKTFTVEEITICTDETTGKQKKESSKHKYAPVGLLIDGTLAVVDYGFLKKFAQKTRGETLHFQLGDALVVRCQSCDVNLVKMQTTPGATIDLDEIA